MSEEPQPTNPVPLGPPTAPPEPLPPPETPLSSFPMVPIGLALVAAIGTGVAMALVYQFTGIYVYILYNSIIGWAIAWGLARAPRQHGYTNSAVLRLLTLAFTVAAYAAYHFVNYLLYLQSIKDQPGVAEIDFISFVFAEAATEFFIGGIQLGTAGTLIVWGIEAAITYFVAWHGISNAIHMHKVEAVPDPVRNYVLQLLAEGRGQEEVDRELTKHGWTRHEDQTRALESAQALMTLMNHSQKQDQG